MVAVGRIETVDETVAREFVDECGVRDVGLRRSPFEAGFGVLAYFNRTFKRVHGATPSEPGGIERASRRLKAMTTAPYLAYLRGKYRLPATKIVDQCIVGDGA